MTAPDKKEVQRLIGVEIKKYLDRWKAQRAEITAEIQDATGRTCGQMVCTQCKDAMPKRYKDALAPSRGTCKKCGGEMKWQKAT